MDKNYGYIYVMEMDRNEGIVKIGRADDGNFESRMSGLEKNGYHNFSHLTRAFAMRVENYKEKEKLLHDLFWYCRVKKTELFAIDLQFVIKVMSCFKGEQVYPDPSKQSQEDVFEISSEKHDVNERIVPDGLYTMEMTLQGTKTKVSGKLLIKDGELTLLKGAIIGPCKEKKKMTYFDKYQQLNIVDGVLKDDTSCDSFSMAASLVCGHNTNGWDKWKDKDLNKIDLYRQKQFEEED